MASSVPSKPGKAALCCPFRKRPSHPVNAARGADPPPPCLRCGARWPGILEVEVHR